MKKKKFGDGRISAESANMKGECDGKSSIDGLLENLAGMKDASMNITINTENVAHKFIRNYSTLRYRLEIYTSERMDCRKPFYAQKSIQADTVQTLCTEQISQIALSVTAL